MAPAAEILHSRPPSLWAMFDGSTSLDGEKAITAMHQPADHLAYLTNKSNNDHKTPYLSWTYGQLRNASTRIAVSMQRLGVSRGTKIATFIPNGIETQLFLWISAMLQLTLIPLDPDMVKPEREEQLREYVERTLPETVLVVDGKGAKALDQTMKACGHTASVRLMLQDKSESRWTGLPDLVSKQSTSEEEVASLEQDACLEDNDNRVAAIMFTSGTSTGRPKGCPIRVKGILNGAMNQIGMGGLPPTLMLYNVNFRVIWLATSAMGYRRRSHLVMPGAAFSPKATLDAIEQCKVQHTICMPGHVHALAREPSFRSRDLLSMRYVWLGGDIITVELQKKAQDLFPDAIVRTCHGMTEGWGVLGWFGEDLSLPVPQYHGILSLGQILPNGLARICSDDGKVLGRLQQGELWLGGPSQIDHYLENVQSHLFVEDKQGNWLRTGDRAMMDENGQIFILGRIKDIIKTKVGASLSPAVIETVLNRNEGVEAVVLGVPHPEYGEVPIAVVRDSEQVKDKDSVKQIVLDKLGPEYALGDVKTLSELGYSEWPLNPTGKVPKVELKEAALRLPN